MPKPEGLTTLGQSDVQKLKMLDYRYIQQALDGQFTPSKSGQGAGFSSIANEKQTPCCRMVIVFSHQPFTSKLAKACSKKQNPFSGFLLEKLRGLIRFAH